MIPAFDPAVDWPRVPFAPGGDPEGGPWRQRSLEHLRVALPIASQLYPVGAWLAAAPAKSITEGLTRCLVAADHWNARIFCGSQTLVSRRCGKYLAGVCERATEIAALALARAAVLATVPERWIPESSVRVGLVSALARAGVTAEVTALHLVPPELGGASWVRRDSRADLEHLRTVSGGSVVAAILIWADHLVPAVVAAVDGAVRAFGDGLPPIGLAFVADELCGVALVTHTLPPIPWRYRLARWLRLDGWLWHRHRKRIPPSPRLDPAEID